MATQEGYIVPQSITNCKLKRMYVSMQ